MSAERAVAENAIAVTDSAVRRIAKLVEEEGNLDLMLRISVSGGGCAGFQYAFALDDNRSPDDLTIVRNGVTVVIDDLSLGLVQGSQLDYVEELVGSYFAVKNPNAASTCGCGTSFSV